MRILVIDTETGGLDPNQHSLLEFSAVWLEEDGSLGDSFQTYIRHDVFHVTQGAMAINHIPLEEADKWPTIKEARANFTRFLVQGSCDWFNTLDNFRKNKIVLGGNNVAFDHRFLSANFPTIADLFSHQHVDTTSLSAALVAQGKLPPDQWRLKGLCDYFNVPNLAPHTASGDAQATAKVLAKLLHGELSPNTVNM